MASAKSGVALAPKLTAKGKFECPICGRAFYSKEVYERHIKIDHSLSRLSGQCLNDPGT